jgi:hypothetical protein
MTFALYELAANPSVQDKVYEEVLSVLGEQQDPTVPQLDKVKEPSEHNSSVH